MALKALVNLLLIIKYHIIIKKAILIRNKKALDTVLGASNIIAEGLDANIKYTINIITFSSKKQYSSNTSLK